MKVHDESKSLKCDVCLKILPNKSALIRHYRTHTGEKPFVCQICDRKFSQKNNLVKHQAIHTGKKPFSCLICNKKFSQKSTLVRHQNTHSDVRSFKCSICPEGRYFKSNRDLKRHMIYHYEPKFSCSHCDYKTHTKGNLKTHMKRHHIKQN